MPLSNKEKALFEQLEARGFKLDTSQDGMPFTFSISPVITVGVDVSIFTDIARTIRAEIRTHKFECEISGLVVFPRILDPEIMKAKKLCSHKRKDHAYFVGLEIECDRWVMGTESERIELALTNLLDSIGFIPDKHMSHPHRNKLAEIFLHGKNTLPKIPAGVSHVVSP